MFSPTATVAAGAFKRRVIAGLWGLFIATQAMAHDFWIEPSSHAVLPGQTVSVRLLVGEHFKGDAVGRPPEAGLHRFVVADAQSGASATLPGRALADPAGAFRPARAGAFIIAFHGKPNAIELPAEKFNAYLEDEGLQAVLAARAERNQLNAPGREIYSRCAKSLLRVGGEVGAVGPQDRALGLPLELIAEPAMESSDGALPLRLLYEGKPLAGALVLAIHRNDPMRKVSQRSDAEGRVVLPLAREGQWLIKAVHMRPAPAASGADWESLWASLSLAIESTH